MSIFVDQKDATTGLQDFSSQGSRTGFVENFEASLDTTDLSGSSISELTNLAEVYDPMIAALNEGRPKRKQFPNPFSRTINDPLFGPDYRARFTPDDLEQRIWAEITARRDVDPSAFGDLPESRDAMREQIYKTVRAADAKANKVGARASTAGVIGQFAGTAVGVMKDPPVAISMLLGAGPTATVARTMAIEAIAGATSEAAVQPDIQRYRAKAGLEATDPWEAIAIAGGASAVFGGVLKGGSRVAGRVAGGTSRVVRMSNDQLLKAFDKLVKKPTAEQRAARHALQAQSDLAKDNPLNGRSGGAEHRARVAEATQAAEEGAQPSMSARPVASMRARVGEDVDNLDGLVYAFKPDELEVDAKLFQFKDGGDDLGVTEALGGVTTWDPVKAGQVLVYEFSDGRRFIADGHQRLGLARRIQSQKDGQHVRLIGQLIRESDGMSPEMARVVAAMKNVAEGSGTAIDAAKVLRIDPKRIGELPPRSALVRQAQDLVSLSDDAFGMVVNKVVPAHFAAVVGRLMPDDAKMQAAALDVLVKANPENMVQAEAIVRQVREIGTYDEHQIGLFGEEIFTKSYVVERAKILDRSLKRLRKDKGVFKSLVANSGDIAKAGNRLADAENLKRMITDEQAIQTLQTLANRKGPLSDALEYAANEAVVNGNWGRAVNGFVAAVRDAAARGDFEGVSIGGSGRVVDAEPQTSIRPGQEQADLDGFSEPAGPAAEQQAAALERAVRDVFEVDVPGREAPLVLDDAVAVHPETGEGIVAAMRRAEAMPITAEIATPERIQLRQKIADDLYGAGAERQEFSVDIVLGPPAAGKSLFSDPLIKERGALLIDSDLAKEVLPEFEGGVGAKAVHQESAEIVEDMVLPRAMAAGDNIVWPMVGKTKANVEAVIDLFKQADYDVNLHLVEVPSDVAIDRAIERFRLTGRLVPPQYISEVADSPVRTFDDLIQRGDIHDYSHYSNDVAQGDPLRLIRDQGSADVRLRRGGESGRDQVHEQIRGRPDAGTKSRTPGTETAQPGRSDGQAGGLDPQSDTTHEIPVGVAVDENGDVIARTRPFGEVIDELDAEASFLDDLEGVCLK